MHLDLNGSSSHLRRGEKVGANPFITVNGGGRSCTSMTPRTAAAGIHYEGKLTSKIGAIPGPHCSQKRRQAFRQRRRAGGRPLQGKIFGTWNESYHIDSQPNRDNYEGLDIWTGKISSYRRRCHRPCSRAANASSTAVSSTAVVTMRLSWCCHKGLRRHPHHQRRLL